MKTRAVCAYCVVSVCLGAAASAQQYTPGFIWDRSADWAPGVIAHSTSGNPAPDSQGASVWSYEFVQGGALGSGNDWFAQSSTMSMWDPDWYGLGGAWVQGDNVNPPIFADRMTHNVNPSAVASVPMVRWMNPAGDGSLVDLAGELTVTWSGHDYIGEPVAVDVVIALNDVSAGLTTPLLATTVHKPLAFASMLDSETIDVDLGGVLLDDGDSLVFSLRGQTEIEGVGRWVILQDDVQITLRPIPGPGAAAVFALAGLGAMRRRR